MLVIKNAVLQGIELAKAKGAKRAVLLPMSIPSHCTLMNLAAQKMQQQLSKITFKSPKIPVLHNADVRQHNESIAIKDILVKQLYSPVLWVNTVRALGADGITHILECGPGKVLSGLNKRIDRNLQSLPLADGEAIRQAMVLLE